MSLKEDLKAHLTKLGVEFAPDAKVDELKALVPEDSPFPVADDTDGIVVKDPMDLRPKELPLVIELPAGASLAQQAFSKVLNAYAYKNPEKWAKKKDDRTVDGKVILGLISKLKALKNASDPVEPEAGVTFKNKLLT